MGTKAVKSIGSFFLIIVTFIIAVVLVLAVLAKYVNPNNSTFMSILTVALPAILLINVITLVSLTLKRKIWAVIPLIAILCSWQYITSMFQINFSDKETNENSFKVATYNVHSFNSDYTGYSAKHISEFMNLSRVDILCMQEWVSLGKFNRDSIETLFGKDFKYKSTPKDSKGRYRVAVFSKYPIIRNAIIQFSNTGNCAMWCDVVIKGDTLRFFNLHLQTTSYDASVSKSAKQNGDISNTVTSIEDGLIINSKKRATQIDRVCEFVRKSKYPVVLCGDFNDLPSSYTYQRVNDLLEDGFKECGSGYASTYNGFMNLLRIDYIFKSHDIVGHNYKCSNKNWSDHRPVIMEMSIKK